MRTETEILNLLLQVAKTLKVEAVALSVLEPMVKLQKMSFRITTWFNIVDDLDTLTRDLAWLHQFGTRNIEQH